MIVRRGERNALCERDTGALRLDLRPESGYYGCNDIDTQREVAGAGGDFEKGVMYYDLAARQDGRLHTNVRNADWCVFGIIIW